MSKRKYELDDNYFDEINTSEKAYWLGFLFADGWVHEKSYSINLELKESDKYIIEKLRDTLFINKDKPILTHSVLNNTLINYRISLTSKHMCNKLISYGCIQNKSLVLKFPSVVPIELMSHFIRGYFDGDGCISISFDKKESKYSKVGMDILGTLDFLQGIQKYILDTLNIEMQISPKTNTIYRIRSSNKANCIKILTLLYLDATFFLQRKFDIYQQCIILQDNSNKKFNNYLISPDGIEHEVNYGLLTFCKKHNINYNILAKWKNKGKIKLHKNSILNIKNFNTINWEIKSVD